MKRFFSPLFTLLLAWTLILGAPASYAQVTVDGTKTGAAFSRTTWAGIAAATTVSAGTLAFVSNLGEHGSFVQSNGTRWRALNGEATLKLLGSAQSGITNSGVIVLQALIPAGAWQVNDSILIWTDLTKSGTTDTVSATFRVGTAGTTSDTAVLTQAALMAAASLNGGYIHEFKLVSDTTVQRVGSANAASGSYGAASSSGTPGAVTISSAAGNALYVSLELASSGAANTVAIQAGKIMLVTP